MPYCRVSFEGYVEGDYETPELAKVDFMDYLQEEGMDLMNELNVEVFNEQTQRWES